MEHWVDILPLKLRYPIAKRMKEYGPYSEIRLRIGQPLIMRRGKMDEYITEMGEATNLAGKGMMINNGMLRNTLDCLCQYSLYAYQDQIKNGFFTIQGGHRVGVAGEVLNDSGGRITGMKYISSMNIRLAGEFEGCSREFLGEVYEKGKVLNTLIVAPPGQGKTSFLRDMILQISRGNSYAVGKNVGVVDERGELSGSARGIPVFDLGPRTDLIYGGNKCQAVYLLLRSMTPSVIAVDELGGKEEEDVLLEVQKSGVSILATVHGDNLEELLRKEGVNKMLQGDFQRVFFLKADGEAYGVSHIYRYDYEKGVYVK